MPSTSVTKHEAAAPDEESKSKKVKREDAKDSKIKKVKVKTIAKKKRNRKGKITTNGVAADVGGFTIIGDVSQFKKSTVKRVLPAWLANPSVVSSDLKDDKAPVKAFNLCPELVKVLEKNFITYFFPVQQQVIPWLMDAHNPKLFRPSDICVSAPTGSGKTLAYVLPIVQILKNSIYSCVRAIVILPTEMLASQVFTVFNKYCTGSDLKVFLMSKRLTLTAEKKALIRTNVHGEKRTAFDIIVATPGRLIDHLEQTEGFDISQLQFLVVDEADRTLDDQQGNWLLRLETKFWSYHSSGSGPPQPWKSLHLNTKSMDLHLKAFHKLLFSATLSQNPETLEKLHLFQPKLFTSIVERSNNDSSTTSGETGSETASKIEAKDNSDSFVGKFTTPEELKEKFVLCQKETKPLVLAYLISTFKWKRVLCFTNTKESTHRLCLLLKFMGNVNVREISSKWSPHTQDLMLRKFSEGSIDILVTSDQMARGIDIPLVDYVISYDLPGYTKTYIHRIGRTARAGKEGTAVSLVLQNQIGMFKKTMKNSGKTKMEKLPVKNSDLKAFEVQFKDALAQLKVHIAAEEEKAKGKKGKKEKVQSAEK